MQPRLDRCYNIADLRHAAKKRLPKGIFEAVDRGTEDEIALAENITAFQRLKLRTRFLTDLSDPDMGTTLFGKPVALPFGIAPTGMAGLLWHEGELALAKAAAKNNIPFTLAMGAITPMDRIAKEAGGRLWYQVYLWEDLEASYEMISKARDLGFEALVVTIDAGLGRAREYNERNGFSFPFSPNLRAMTDMALHPQWLWSVMLPYLLNGGIPRHVNYPSRYQQITTGSKTSKPKRFDAMTWDDFARLREIWPGKLIAKSILSGEEARRAIDHGADAIVVSNHGGRSLDSAPATIDVLPEVVEAANSQCTIILDSGIRRGSDVVKALALGADFTMIGRASLYGIACGGIPGANHAISILAKELERTCGSIGCRTIEEIRERVKPDHYPYQQK